MMGLTNHFQILRQNHTWQQDIVHVGKHAFFDFKFLCQKRKQIDLNKAQNGPLRVGNWQAAVIETYHQAHCCGHHSELGTSPYFRTNPRPSPTIPILSHYYRIIILSNLYLHISCNVVYRSVWWYSIVRNFPNFIQCPAFFFWGGYFIVVVFPWDPIFFRKAQSPLSNFLWWKLVYLFIYKNTCLLRTPQNARFTPQNRCLIKPLFKNQHPKNFSRKYPMSDPDPQ